MSGRPFGAAGAAESGASSDASRPGAHLLVVDDDERIRALLRRYLARSGFYVTGARDAAHARRLLEGLAFDLLIVDVMMPGEDGLSLVASLRPRIATPVLLLTARGAAQDRIRGLEAGADDYLAKPFEPRELLLRIHAILRRAAPPEPAPEPPRVLSLGEVRYDVARGELWRGEERIRLTATEGALLRVLAAAAHEPVDRATLLAELDDAQERAVDVQITRLRRKIEPDPKAPRYIQTVRGAGYMLTPD
ncbi:response regulator [Oceanicella actignis]|uniref:response regulator n=1 Tax=Oceanicella actignis TaxID=1189325 RepID=UPI0011E6A64E|nr:response regulator [Oceanicella actignis]TYO88829.1 two-component system phosphate regulon response regulator OmpR [Oceanicella actignis]